MVLPSRSSGASGTSNRPPPPPSPLNNLYEVGKGNILSHFERMATPDNNNHTANEDHDMRVDYTKNRYDDPSSAATSPYVTQASNMAPPVQPQRVVHLRKRRTESPSSSSMVASSSFKYADFNAHMEKEARCLQHDATICRLEPQDGDEPMQLSDIVDNNAMETHDTVMTEVDEMGAGGQRESTLTRTKASPSSAEHKPTREELLREWQKNKQQRDNTKTMKRNARMPSTASTTSTSSSRLSTNASGRKSVDNIDNNQTEHSMFAMQFSPPRQSSLLPPPPPPSNSSSSRRSTLDAVDPMTMSPITPNTSETKLRSSNGPRKRWKNNSALEASFSNDAYSPNRSYEFLNRDLEDEHRANSSKSDRERAYIYKKRYVDTYGFVVDLAKKVEHWKGVAADRSDESEVVKSQLEHLTRVAADQRDEIQVLKSKVETQERILSTVCDHEPLDDDDERHAERRVYVLCREISALSRQLAERDGHIESLQREREESVHTMNRLKLSQAACRAGDCGSSHGSADVEMSSAADAAARQAVQASLDAERREKEQALKQVEQLRAELAAATQACHSIESTRDTLSSNLNRNAQQLDVLRSQRDEEQARANQAEQRVSQLEAECARLRAELQTVTSSFQASSENENKYLSMLDAQHHAVAESKHHIQTLETQLSEVRRRLAELAEKELQISTLERELTMTKNELITANAKNEMLQQQVNIKHQEMHDLERRLHERIVQLETRIYNAELVRRSLHNKVMELKGNIRVFCRVRPVLRHEASEEIFAFPDYHGERRQIELHACPKSHVSYAQNGSRDTVKKYQFDFDMVFNGNCTQEELFLEVSALVQSALDGYNVCIFAYGQTGSGKTYTMQGKEEGEQSASHRGIVGRALSHIFGMIVDLRSSAWDFSVSLEMIEIYNETLRDLLAPPGSTDKVDLRLDIDGKPMVTNSCIHAVENEVEALRLLQKAMSRRATKMTNMNDRSSRSHCVITLRLQGVNSLNGERRNGVVHLVDLAGSERLSKSGSGNDREMLKEAQAINKSLSSLGNVICALAKKSAHVPFRDSKLTHFLSPSLGGDSKTLMICNLSPLQQHRDESLNSLRFSKTVNSCEIALPSFSSRS